MSPPTPSINTHPVLQYSAELTYIHRVRCTDRPLNEAIFSYMLPAPQTMYIIAEFHSPLHCAAIDAKYSYPGLQAQVAVLRDPLLLLRNESN